MKSYIPHADTAETANADPELEELLCGIETDELTREVARRKANNKELAVVDSSIAEQIDFEPEKQTDCVFKLPAPKAPTVRRAVSPPPTPRHDGYGNGRRRKYTYDPTTDPDLDRPILFRITCNDTP